MIHTEFRRLLFLLLWILSHGWIVAHDGRNQAINDGDLEPPRMNQNEYGENPKELITDQQQQEELIDQPPPHVVPTKTDDLNNDQLQLRYAFYESALFNRVQTEHIFEDSKTFVDCTAKKELMSIMNEYNTQNPTNLTDFVLQNFVMPENSSQTVAQELADMYKNEPLDIRFQKHLVNVLKHDIRKSFNSSLDNSKTSLLYLPYETVIPGGRFREWYYWDSYLPFTYFIQTGNPDDKQFALGMINNIQYLLKRFGFVPTGNRDYYLGRSQPPVYSLMVEELFHFDQIEALKHLPTLITSFKSWTTSTPHLSNETRPLSNAVSRAVKLGNTTSEEEVYVYTYNSAWGDYPRPEMYAEDLLTSRNVISNSSSIPNQRYRIFEEIQATCESGWDFSSRFEGDCLDLDCLETTHIAPVDLQALIQHHASLIVKLLKYKETTTGSLNDDDEKLLEEYEHQATTIANTILKYFWDEHLGAFSDLVVSNGTSRHMLTPAAAVPILVNITGIDNYKIKRTLETIRDRLLFTGGVVTTSIDVSELDINSNKTPKPQQWDKPMGWAPLQWFVYRAAFMHRNDDPIFDNIATNIRSGWVSMVKNVYKETGVIYEKYNVAEMTRGGGGEYIVQAGFAFTNAVTLLFLEDMTETTITV